MRYWGAILALALLALPLAATAQPVSGLYISGGLGADLPQNTYFTPSSPVDGATRLKTEDNLGFTGLGAIGYGLGDGFRFEIEGDFARNGVQNIYQKFPTTTSGTEHTYGVMVNALYDLDIGSPWIYPYLGAGAGYQWSHFDGVSVTQIGGPFRLSTDATAGAFAWQAIAGVSVPIPSVRGLSFTAEYRFMETLGGPTYGALETPVGGGPAVFTDLKLHNQFDHLFLIGLRYEFNTPAPPAPVMTPAAQAVPTPAPSRSYLVFFDWDKATLTDRARQIIQEAADNSRRVQYTRIMVNGYTDTSGTPQYNMGLSIRRARAVEGELIHDGVPQNVIAIRGYGETHLLVPTGPGVREPQNRRVEIIIQ
ncbi:MAG TPA: OmpA family protein [Acetobacteraceae bacterium]|nr:OmpA family protein [Acetobacteraceae bacterium]